MNSSLYLTREQVEELTDRKTRPAQEKRLRELGIPFVPGKPPKVLRTLVDELGGVKPLPQEQRPGYAVKPDFSIFQNVE